MVFLIWIAICYIVWPTVEILVTGERTVSTTDNWMALFFLLAMYWSYKIGKQRASEQKHEPSNVVNIIVTKEDENN